MSKKEQEVVAEDTTEDVAEVATTDEITGTDETFEAVNQEARKLAEEALANDADETIPDDTEEGVNGVKIGRYKIVDQRFEKEFLTDGKCRLTFGSGTDDSGAFDSFMTTMTDIINCDDPSNLNVANLLDVDERMLFHLYYKHGELLGLQTY